MSKRRYFCAAATTAAALAGGYGHAFAQQGAAGAPQLQEVVITARKRVERLQDVPVSVNVTSGKLLEAAGTKDLKGLELHVPNLFIQPSPGNQGIYIRGVGSQPANFGFEQSVGLFIDGIYAGRSRQFATPFLDVDSIEVLRGPQGALFGKNTSAGAINITTRGPTKTLQFETIADATVDGDVSYGLTQYVSGPITDSLGVRLAVQASHHDGYIKNLTNPSDRSPSSDLFAGRLTVDYKPTDKLSVRLKLEADENNIGGQPMITSVKFPTAYTRSTTPGVPDYDDGRNYLASATVNYELPNRLTLTSITGYSAYNYSKHIDSDFLAINLLRSGFVEHFEQESQEFRLTSPSEGPLSYIVGLYLHRNTIDLTTTTGIHLGPFNGLSTRVFGQEDKTWSVYGQASYQLTSHLKLTAGVRETGDDKTGDETNANTGVLPPSFVAGHIAGAVHMTALDPSAQIQYAFNPSAMVYASYGKGTKAGGFVAALASLIPSQFTFRPETGGSAEVGAKLSFLNHRVRVNAAAFHTEYSSLQVSVFNAASNSFVTGNAGAVTTQGLEAEVDAQLTKAISLSTSAAYLDAHYTNFPGAACVYPLPNASPSCTENIKGTPLPRAPRWSVSSTLSLNQPLADDLTLKGDFTVAYKSDYFADDSLNPVARQKGFAKIDARLALAGPRDLWEVAVIGKNLTSQLTTPYAYGTPFVAGSETFVVDPPRTIAAQLLFKY